MAADAETGYLIANRELKMMRHRFSREDVLTIPNAMSSFRLLLIPVIVWLYCRQKNYLWAAAVTALSAATDIADGKIARRFSMVSDFGKVLDPVADKLTQASLMICLLSRYSWLWMLIVLFALKEILMAIWGYLTLTITDSVNGAQWYGKLSTVVLYAVIMVLFLFPQIPETAAVVLAVACAFVMVLSLVLYGKFYSGILTKEALGEKRKQMILRIGRILLGLIWTAIIVALFCHKKGLTVNEILRFTPSNPVLAALTMLALFALKSISVVLYSGILYAVNGILFPLPAAILLNLFGMVIMVTIPYWIGKKTGAAGVNRIAEKYPKADKLREFRRQNDFVFVLIVRFIRILPSDIVSLYMGAVGVNYPQYLLGCFLGMLRSAITFPIMGMSAANIYSPPFWIALCVELVFLAGSVLIYGIYKKKHEIKTDTKGGS